MEERNHDVYNHPLSNQEAEKQQNITGGNTDQQFAKNPNPRANENVKYRDSTNNENNNASDVGSEITDGEDG